MCFYFTSNEKCHFSSEQRDPAKRVVDFPLERDTFRSKIMEIVKDFDEKSYNNNGKSWKSSRILRMNPFKKFSFFFHHFSSFFHFLIYSFSHFFEKKIISFFHFFIFSFFHFFIFFKFSFFFIFFHFLPFSIMFFHFLSFSLSLLGAQNLIFFGPQFRYDFS